ncbi:ketosteroid isomerase-like protein [Kibdelosporangium banguiense]|uniref:Ketosteroid isomerase-like protein n=1 Tax=Kibdelosporangium banguiense TaxID=1365924 RepID=A0ABS4TX17_9PSEU|nr:nuclear transport factor 2 family protein [Kibdelosporangium banguiense]MBP2328947.1 ketosteroid isomerase-like protein [Kibdelosporangium banguiense]
MSATPREVFETLLDGVVERRFDGLADLYAEDTVVDLPFALPEPLHREGRQALADHFAWFSTLPVRFAVANLRIHETTDPEVIVAEYDYNVHVTTTGKELTTANIQVMRVRDGKIVESRDFHNHAVIGAAYAGD